MELHPIMYVPDQYAEREFYRLFGFEDHYVGDEFPGFLAIRNGAAIIGLQRSSDQHPAYSEGLRWQFEVDSVDELERLILNCTNAAVSFELEVETGGSAFSTRILSVVSPAGVTVCFEGPNEAQAFGTG
jgi:hypothetical protein